MTVVSFVAMAFFTVPIVAMPFFAVAGTRRWRRLFSLRRDFDDFLSLLFRRTEDLVVTKPRLRRHSLDGAETYPGGLVAHARGNHRHGGAVSNPVARRFVIGP